MKKSKFTETQIVQILKETDAGMLVKDVCRKYGISSPTYYSWKSKYGGLGGYGLSVVERVPLNTIPTPENEGYLRTKRERMGHHIDMHDGQGEGK